MDKSGKVLATCNSCRATQAKRNNKRKALQELDPNVPSKKRVTGPEKATATLSIPQLRPNPPRILEPRPIAPTLLEPRPISPGPTELESRPNLPILLESEQLRPSVLEPRQDPAQAPQPPPIPSENGFLSAEQWGWIQRFNKKMAEIKMETCTRCKETWFLMDLKDNVCHDCVRKDKGNKTPFLMSGENDMDPGELPAHLPELTQVEEMIIARCHVQMMVYRYRGHQYHYSGHCVSFMQNTTKTVSMLPNLPSELDIVVLRPSNQVVESDQRYQRQFRSTFRVRRGHVITWLRYLKANHPDYRHITISLDRLDTLPVDDDVSSSFPSVIDNPLDEEVRPVLAENAPPNSQSMVPNLNITETEVDLILQEISGLRRTPPGLPAPEVRSTPIDEAAGNERIFAMAFPTLYPTGIADLNAPRIRPVRSPPYTHSIANLGRSI
jgi:hypothetical protein